jgi:hypothetical protein
MDIYTRKLETLNPQDFTDSYNYSIGGVPISHKPCEGLALEMVFMKYRCKSAIELGTWQGGLSILLSIMTDGNFLTMDIEDFAFPRAKRVMGLFGAEFKLLNIFDWDATKQILLDSRPYKTGRTLFYVDNGNKFRELQLIADIVREDDVVMAHDHHVEWEYEGLGAEYPLKPIEQEMIANLKSTQLVLKRSA